MLLAKKVYGKSMKELYDTNRTLFFDVRRGVVKETTQAGKGAKVKGNIQIPTKDVRQPDGKIKKIELPVRYPNKEVEKNFKKAVRNIFKKPAGNIPFKTLAKDFPITERQAIRAAKQIKKEEGLQYAKGRTSQEYIKEVREPLIKKTDSPRVLKRIGVERARFLKDKPEVFGKIDTAHRASKSHMARLGLQFDTRLVGMDSRLINQVVLKPAENMLDKLYERRENILDNIKNKPTDEQKKILKEINDSVKKVVKTTSGRFVGIIVDPNTLEPSFSGIKKNLAFSKVNKTMKEIEKLPGAPAVTGGFQSNIKNNEYFKFIRDNVQKSVSGEIKKGFVPNDFKVILSDPKNRKNLLDYAKKNTPDIFSKFKQILNNPTSTRRFALYSKLPAVAIPAGIAMSLISDEAQAADGTEARSILPEVAGGAAAGSLAFKPVRQAVGKGLKATGRLLGKLAVPIGLGAEAYFAKQAYDEGKSIPEIMAAPFLLEGKVRQAQDMLRMKPEERQAVNREMIEEDFSGLSSDFDTPTLEGVDDVDIEEVKERVLQQRLADEARRREERKAGGGIAGLSGGIDEGPPPESGPNPQGLENLKYYVTNT